MRRKNKEQELLECMMEIVTQADEDMPKEYRTKHFKTALEDAKDLIKRSRIL